MVQKIKSYFLNLSKTHQIIYLRPMKNLLSVLLVISCFFSCKESPNSMVSVSGSDWQFVDYSHPAPDNILLWNNATVPGSIQKDLLNLGQIPDPFKLNNEDSIQWVSERDWAYKKEFDVSSEILTKQNHYLKFEGLDTYASIKLNDSLIGSTENAFRIFEFDVSKIIKEHNTLEIVFTSPEGIERAKEADLNYTLPESPRVFTRKPQFQYGWDWGPTIKTIGVWRDVSLVSYDKVRLQESFIETVSISEEKASLNAHLTVDCIKKGMYDIWVENLTTGETHKKRVELDPSTTTYILPLEIKEPKLWWTHNLGKPNLYEYRIQLRQDQQVLDFKKSKVGIRTIELVTEKDSIGESFYFKLNGKPVYMKGANYIPQNIFLADVTPKQRIKLLDDAVAANMNMLRVWGGGVYEDDLFYDLCDEKGILIWQDFMFACAMYPGDEDFLANVKAEAIDNVKRLRQHPSIALYCGNNENSEGWHRWGWQADKTEAQKEEIWTSYQAVFNELLPKVVDSLSPSISYWESSPKYGRGDKRYQFEGDAHDWWVWHDGYPFEHFEEEVPRFMSEFGFQSFPSYEAIKYFTAQDSIDLDHPSFATHQKHARGFQLIKEYMARDFPVPTNDEDYVYVSQLLQAYGIRKGIRAHRAAKPYNMGTLYWQLNDCWPVVSWSSIDGLGNWKALHYKARRAFKNRLIVPFEENNILKIKVVDDSPKLLTDDLFVVFHDMNGTILHQTETKSVSTFNEKNEVVYEVDLSNIYFDRTSTFAKVYFGDTHALHYFVSPKDLKLSAQNITTEIQKVDDGYEIKLSATTLQKDVFLFSEEKGHFSDNFFDLLPNSEKTIHFETDANDLKEIHLKTLNGIQENFYQ
jgi:beta-mannosidase